MPKKTVFSRAKCIPAGVLAQVGQPMFFFFLLLLLLLFVFKEPIAVNILNTQSLYYTLLNRCILILMVYFQW